MCSPVIWIESHMLQGDRGKVTIQKQMSYIANVFSCSLIFNGVAILLLSYTFIYSSCIEVFPPDVCIANTFSCVFPLHVLNKPPFSETFFKLIKFSLLC